MAITVKHSKVSTIPDDADTSLVRPSDWNADHTLTGTIPVANGGTGASTANGGFNALAPSQTGNSGKYLTTDGTDTSWATNPLGTVTSVAATAGTGISVTGSPITTSGTLNITNTAPDQTVVLTAGTGISTSGTYPNFTITNTSPSSGGNVVGPASATDNAVARFDTTTGKLIQNSVTTIDDTGNASGILSQQFSNGSAVTLAAGKLWYDGSTGSWNAGMGGGNITQQIGEELFVYGKASAAITDSPLQIIYHTGTVGSSGVITFAPTIAGITDENAIIGVATENIALNGFGRVTAFGVVRGITTNGAAFGETWADDDVIWYNGATGNPTKIKPSAPNIKFQIGTVINAGSGGSGSFQVHLVQGTQLGGTDSNVQITSPTAAQILTYSTTSQYWKNTSLASGTGISTSTNANGTLTVTNTAPDQTVAIASGTGISVTGTYPSFTVTNTSPSSGGTVTSVAALTLGTTGTDLSSTVATGTTTPVITLQVPTASATNRGALSAADWTTFNNKGSGTVTSVSGTATRITSTGGTTPIIDLASGVATAGTTGSSTLIPVVTIDTYGRVTGITTASNPQGTVTSVTGTAPVVSSGGATPAISMAAATTSVNGYLTSTDWNTFNGKAPATTYTSTYVPYGQGTTTPNQSSSYTFDGTTQNAPIQRASNGIFVNSNTVSATYSIPSGSNAMSAGPITINSGITVTVASGSRWVVL